MLLVAALKDLEHGLNICRVDLHRLVRAIRTPELSSHDGTDVVLLAKHEAD